MYKKLGFLYHQGAEPGRAVPLGLHRYGCVQGVFKERVEQCGKRDRDPQLPGALFRVRCKTIRRRCLL